MSANPEIAKLQNEVEKLRLSVACLIGILAAVVPGVNVIAVSKMMPQDDCRL